MKIEDKPNNLNCLTFMLTSILLTLIDRQVLEVIKHPRVGVWYQKDCSIHISFEGNNCIKHLIYKNKVGHQILIILKLNIISTVLTYAIKIQTF